MRSVVLCSLTAVVALLAVARREPTQAQGPNEPVGDGLLARVRALETTGIAFKCKSDVVIRAAKAAGAWEEVPEMELKFTSALPESPIHISFTAGGHEAFRVMANKDAHGIGCSQFRIVVDGKEVARTTHIFRTPATAGLASRDVHLEWVIKAPKDRQKEVPISVEWRSPTAMESPIGGASADLKLGLGSSARSLVVRQ